MSITPTAGQSPSNKQISKKSLAILTTALLVLAGFVFYFSQEPDLPRLEPKETQPSFKRTIIPNRDIFYNAQLFSAALASVKSSAPNASWPGAVVVPHHLLAANIIANTLARASLAEIETVVLIGPNHDDKNASTIATAQLEWQTPVGSVITAGGLVDKFLSDFRLQPLPEPFLNEHSVGAIVPFVRHYFPQAQVVPIIFNSTASLSDAQAVARWLVANLKERSLVVVSTDFSHYLTQEEAEKNDKITKQLILNQKVEAIMGLSNAFVDSPPSLATVLFFTKGRSAAPEVLYHANANDFSERPFRETTSYFGIIFN
ncbi:MAG: AmmeMemoRadiSam system protein B [Candidatus Komeilibacteria bacterium]|nr:AmmeMemoRadiSam system protein B [Candidatus Komeilibacteria bacterium]